MSIKTLSVKADTASDAVIQAKELLSEFKPKFIVFFASSFYDPDALAEEMEKQFPNIPFAGSTSHSEYCNSDYTDHTISMMAMDSGSIENLAVKVIPDIKSKPDFSKDIQEMECYFGGKDSIFEHFDRYVGIVLFESGAKSEEIFMDKLGTATDILFVGGSSSDAGNGVSRVYANGKAYENAAVLVVLKTVHGYDVLKTQSASIFSDQTLLVTKSDLSERILHEFDHKPCGTAYAEILKVPENEIQNYFVSNPLGVVAGEEIFVRTFNEITTDGITLHCGIPEGTEIHVLKIGDIIQDTKNALDSVITYSPSGVINFNCLYRTFEMLNKNLTQPYCELFGRYPSIGFSTAGEAFLGHINETSTILVIK